MSAAGSQTDTTIYYHRKRGGWQQTQRISLANPHTLKSTHHPTKEDTEGCELKAAPTNDDAISANQDRWGHVDQAGPPGLVAKTQTRSADACGGHFIAHKEGARDL